jgi:hypothetical protein
MEEKKKKPYGYWTKELCIEDAKKYKTRSEWGIKSIGAYKYATKNGYLDECCAHMECIGSSHKRLIYVYIFPDKHVYVGLTFNETIRKDQHLSPKNKKRYSSVYKHILRTKQKPTYVKLTDYIPKDEASDLESHYIEKYKNEGYKLLNKKKGGGLGGNFIKWTKELCIEDAKKYKTRTEWCMKSHCTYESARKNGYLDECCTHMPKKERKPRGYWTKERCIEDAKQYKTKKEWQIKSLSAYATASKNGWVRIPFPPKKAVL